MEPTMLNAHVWECVELEYTAGGTYANPFRDLECFAVFKGPERQEVRISGFWDGDGVWKFRFAPPCAGSWSWAIESNPVDAGLSGNTGSAMVREWTAEELERNPNRRGFVRVHESGRYFEYADGTPFFWLGDTLWAANTKRCDAENVLPRILRNRKESGFNVFQIAAAHPGAGETEEEGAGYYHAGPAYYTNEGGAAYQNRYDRINPAFFRGLDKRLELMLAEGFLPCLIGLWNGDLAPMGVERVKEYWRYLIARYAAYNIVWSVAGEYSFQSSQVNDWRAVGEEIHRCDPYGHPTSAHAGAPESGSSDYQSEEWYDFSLVQTTHMHAYRQWIDNWALHDYRMEPTKPSIMSESWYENHPSFFGQNQKRFDAWDIRYAAYVSFLQGCIGQTYGAHGVWSLYEDDQSDRWVKTPTWRPDPWLSDLELEGAKQMRHVRALMDRVDWTRLVPHPDLISSAMHANAYCAAIPGEQYVAYVTSRTSVDFIVNVAEKGGETYDGQWFNPRTGEWTEALEAGGWSKWMTVTPAGEDWVLVLNKRITPS